MPRTRRAAVGGSRRRSGAWGLLAALASTGAIATTGTAPPDAVLVPSQARVALRAPTLDAPLASGRAEVVSWWGGPITTGAGDTLSVFLSDSYPRDEAARQRWADFFASLVHGSELSLLAAYVATPAEVQELCQSESSLGCYGQNELVTIGEPVGRFAPATVATHEYGHHVAANRLNPPWIALDSGPKRWASTVGVCARTAAGTAFPGDEERNYGLNPGEGFAESYRALNESRAGATSFDWPIVDGTFYPDAAALTAVADDVLRPWTGPRTRTARGTLRARGKKTWTLSFPTPLDGDLRVAVSLARGALDDVVLLEPGATKALATGLWAGATEKTLSFQVCGQRSLVLRVTRRGAAGRFAVTLTQP